MTFENCSNKTSSRSNCNLKFFQWTGSLPGNIVKERQINVYLCFKYSENCQTPIFSERSVPSALPQCAVRTVLYNLNRSKMYGTRLNCEPIVECLHFGWCNFLILYPPGLYYILTKSTKYRCLSQWRDLLNLKTFGNDIGLWCQT